MISKELLSEVLEKEISEIVIIGNTINYVVPNNETEEDDGEIVYIDLGININIYELAFYCKEWAYKNGYILLSKPRTSSSFASCSFDKIGKSHYSDNYHNDFRAETEIEAIFNACEWILEQIKGNK